MSKIDELLAKLDLPEEEQRKAIGNLVVKQRSHNVKCLDWIDGDWTITPCRHCGKTWETYSKRTKDKSSCKGPFVYKGSLADLAFRLRDEVCKEINGCEKYHAGLEAVYKHYYGGRKIVSFYAWQEYQIKPIDMIIAALCAAKELAKE